MSRVYWRGSRSQWRASPRSTGGGERAPSTFAGQAADGSKVCKEVCNWITYLSRRKAPPHLGFLLAHDPGYPPPT
jgi:hypothetical protein